MSALALILMKRGYSISGSDQKPSQFLKSLSAQGIKIFKQQNATNIQTICQNNYVQTLVVVSTAVPNSNPELKAAKKQN